MTLAGVLYNGITKRTSTMVLTIIGGAFLFERGFDSVADYIWETHNKGKLWKDIKGKYEVKEEE
uniref:Complex III subunit 9 n=1 Tax=Pseudodiaptomus poplesia TaxID=213370 RepID=A0A0U2UPJ5_9MAXI|nr:cytochrome b-c1 complex subunit 9 [Pseudodiaptomus poplesia]ALS04862.1 cytochrome b-c1 complex subunit 9 [Pseudodiaptomus poplesia]